MECLVRKEAEERADRRATNIMLIGSVLNFALPLLGTSLFFFHPPKLPGDPMIWALCPLVIPFGNGALVAFLGTVFTDRHQGIMEWGFTRPAKCLLYGLAPYMLLGVQPRMIAALGIAAFAALVAAVASGLLTAWLLKKTAYARI